MTVKVLPNTVLDNIMDPLAAVLAPPPSETDEERERRQDQEQEAKRISDVIDEQIDRERKAEKPMKILLLGGSLNRTPNNHPFTRQ